MKPQKCAKNGFPVVAGVIIFCAFLWPVSAQRKSGDPNKFAVIINGAGGEEVYAKQFEEWTRQLSSVLSDRFGFDAKHVTTLKNATADQVKATFGTLKSDLRQQRSFRVSHRSRYVRWQRVEVQPGGTRHPGDRIQRAAFSAADAARRRLQYVQRERRVY